MNSGRFITTRVRTAVNAAFAAASSDEAFTLLASTPFKEGPSAEVGEQILLGLVCMAKGDLKRLRSSVEYFDPRDALYAFHGVNWDEELKNSRT